MKHYIDKSTLVAEIERRLDKLYDLLPDASKVENSSITISEACNTGKYTALESFRKYIDTLEVKEIEEEPVSKELNSLVKEYSFNIQSELFNQLTKEQQVLWRKEIEQAFIDGSKSK